jgi:Family of unknown function (DUF6011)
MATLKARKNYKEDVKKAMAPKLTKEEKKAVEKFKNDMENCKLNKQHEEQVKEFMEFLSETIRKAHEKGKNVDFFNSMKSKLSTGVVLTDNMVSAIRKCMEREKQWAKEKEAKKNEPARVITLKIKPFLMKDLKIDSRLITGTVKAESAKAWLIEGHADMLENMCWCARCGKELTEPASQTTGYGAICAEKLGIPYDPKEVLGASKAKRAKIRKQFKQKLLNQKFERWIPKSQAEVYEG